jgi:L-arabinose isomerase
MTFENRRLTNGGSHHTVLSRALDTEVFADFAEILGIELVVIDAETSMRRFANELNWGQAYYQLFGGL